MDSVEETPLHSASWLSLPLPHPLFLYIKTPRPALFLRYCKLPFCCICLLYLMLMISNSSLYAARQPPERNTFYMLCLKRALALWSVCCLCCYSKNLTIFFLDFSRGLNILLSLCLSKIYHGIVSDLGIQWTSGCFSSFFVVKGWILFFFYSFWFCSVTGCCCMLEITLAL